MYPTARQIGDLQDELGKDLYLFLPELVVCAGIVVLLLCRLVRVLDRAHLGGLAVAILAVALFAAGFQVTDTGKQDTPFFSGMLASDAFAGLVRTLILAAALFTVVLTLLTGIPDREDSADFHALLLGGTLGMMLMASANHLLMVFIAVEMASLPSYALAGFLKGKKPGSEAALKYVVFGAAASGVMLYGITLIAGTFGTGYLPDVAKAISLSDRLDPAVLAGFALLLVGLGFKLAAVPFHFWCPDVFEGAAAEVAGFLSVASKAAAVALTARVLLRLQAAEVLSPWLLPGSLGLGLGVVAAVTVTFGNLAAFAQTNLKRLLAYSTIAHAGYMLLGVAVMTTQAASAVLYYLAAYLLMNQGAFAVVALVRNLTGSETIDAYRGLVWRSPVLAVTMALFLFSLLGFPPLAGFAGKFQVFDALYEAGKAAVAAGRSDLGAAWYALFGVGAVNTALSAYYYLRVVRAMLLEDESSPAVVTGRLSAPAASYLSVLAALLVALGVVWNPLTAAADRAAATFGMIGQTPSGVSRP
ncbi:MAG TPA: NADH-quinone oxidoreductase subunit N [Gemmataceae bacterium]|nr:NADH-quinone oxidoreductase subunit N [Gemmataceae bacterium]